jgi:hypothetical protein
VTERRSRYLFFSSFVWLPTWYLLQPFYAYAKLSWLNRHHKKPTTGASDITSVPGLMMYKAWFVGRFW